MNRLATSAGIVPAAAPAAAPYAAPGVAVSSMATLMMGPGAMLAGVAPVAAAVPSMPGLAAAVPGAADLSLQQGLLGPASPIPTACLLLKNMFDPAAQTEANWEAEVADDVRDEAARFGAVLHLHVDKNSQVRAWGEGGFWVVGCWGLFQYHVVVGVGRVEGKCMLHLRVGQNASYL